MSSRETEEEPGEWEPPSFLPTVRMGCAVQTQQFMNLRAGMLGLWEETIAEMFTERTGGGEYGAMQTGISFLPCDMSFPGFKEQTVFLFISCLLPLFTS